MVITFVSIWPNPYTPVSEYRSQQYLKWFELPEIYHRTELKKGGACIDSKTAKTGRDKVSDSKCNLVKIENLYRNIFTLFL